MAKYNRLAKAETQAKSAIKAIVKIDSNAIRSLQSRNNYQQGLKNVCQWIKDNDLKQSLRDLSKEQAIQYLTEKSSHVSQSTLDLDRQAIQKMFQVLTGVLPKDENLPVIKSKLEEVKESRAYFPEQMEAIARNQSARNALATRISYAAGLRAHEFLTLRRIEERNPDNRPASPLKFSGRPTGDLYTVQGKGGLVRVVSIPKDLAKELESRRRPTPYHIVDRKISYKSYYDIGGGRNWSKSVTEASKKVCGFSNGAHGLRHSYAQDRMRELMDSGIKYHEALEIVSQEMGHFREEITLEYLR